MKKILVLILVLIAFAGNSLLNRLALADGLISAESFVVIRIVSAAVVLTLIAITKGEKILIKENLLAGGMLFVYAYFFSIAYLNMDAALGALVLFGVVQITMFLGAVKMGEHPRTATWIAMIIGVIGLAILVGPSGGNSFTYAILLMAVAGIAWGVFCLVGGHCARSPISTMASSFSIAIVPCLFLAPRFVSEFSSISPTGWILALASGAITSGLGYAAWYAILPQLRSTTASLAQLSVPIIAALGAVLFLGEVISLRFVFASVMILGSISVSILWNQYRPH